MTDLFPDTTPALDAAHLRSLHTDLAQRARVDHLLDVAYRTVDSPVGTLLLAATERGLVRVAFAVEGFDAVLERLAVLVSPRVLESCERTDGVARELDEYFAGRRATFDLSLDRALSPMGFRRDVHEYLSRIPFGATESYGEVAAHVGSPRAVRAVGTACATNPLPIVVPCHRVLRADGSVGQYLGGTPAKVALLALEASDRPDSTR